jgi:GNAT superfamily N-acetyltransferase
MNLVFEDYVISDDKNRLNLDTLLGFLKRSYWASDRSRESTEKAIANSLCIGVYHLNKQIGFARIVTDYATVYYLCDVFIDENHRGAGIGKKLIEAIVNYDELIDLTGLLGTKDAHSLYEHYGFLKDSTRFMRRPSQ